MFEKNNNILLPTIFVLALVLRLAGILHGFPFIFHPDEPAVIRTAQAVKFFPNPGHFDWPHLYIYVNFVLYMVFAKFRSIIELLNFKSTLLPYLGIFWDDRLIFYYLSRILSAILGALTVVPIYFAAKDAFGKRTGVFAALALAFAPFHVWHSHYALIDVPMMFFASWSLYFSLKVLKRGDITDYAGAGFYSGLAAATKYNGVLISIAVPIAHFLRVIKNKEPRFNFKGITNLFIAAVVSVMAFLLGTPYALLDFKTFVRTDGPKGALWQFTNVGSVDAIERLPKFINEMLYRVSDDLGYTILAGFFSLSAVLIYRWFQNRHGPRHEDFYYISLIFFVGLALLLYVSGVKNSRSHYYFITYPLIIVGFAYFVELLLRYVSKMPSIIGLSIFVLMLGFPAFLSVKNSYTFIRNDTRVHLYKWLKTNTSTTDNFYYNNNSLKQVMDSFINPSVKTMPPSTENRPGYVLIVKDNVDIKLSQSLNPKLVVQVNDNLRLGPLVQVYSINK